MALYRTRIILRDSATYLKCCSSLIAVRSLRNRVTENATDALHQAETVSQLAVVTAKKPKLIESSNIVAELTKFNAIHSDGMSEASTREEFSLLCNRLVHTAWQLEPGSLVVTFGVLVRLGLSPSTVLAQTVLHLIIRNVNSLSLQEITLLSYILTKCKSTPLTNTLNIALPLAFKNQISSREYESDSNQLSDLFHYACQHGLGLFYLERLSGALMDVVNTWKTKDAEYILWGLATTKINLPNFKELADAASNLLAQDVNLVSNRNSLLKLLERLLAKSHHNELFLHAVKRNSLTENWSFNELHSLGIIFGRISSLEVAFLEKYIMAADKKVHADPNGFPIEDVLKLLANASVTSSLTANFSETLLGHFVSQHEDALKEDPHRALQLALNLELNGCSSAPILAHVDINELLERWSPATENFWANLQDCLMLKSLANVEDWNDFLTDKLRGNLSLYCARLSKNKIDSPLTPILRRWFGAHYAIYNNIVNKNGIFVDHLFVKREERESTTDHEESLGHPDKAQFLEDCLNILSCNPLAIMLHGGFASRYDKASTLLLKKNGFAVLELSLTTWNELLEHERRPYLERCIDEAFGNKNM